YTQGSGGVSPLLASSKRLLAVQRVLALEALLAQGQGGTPGREQTGGTATEAVRDSWGMFPPSVPAVLAEPARPRPPQETTQGAASRGAPRGQGERAAAAPPPRRGGSQSARRRATRTGKRLPVPGRRSGGSRAGAPAAAIPGATAGTGNSRPVPGRRSAGSP